MRCMARLPTSGQAERPSVRGDSKASRSVVGHKPERSNLNRVGRLGVGLMQLVERMTLCQLRNDGGDALMLWTEDNSVGRFSTTLLDACAKGRCVGQNPLNLRAGNLGGFGGASEDA